MIQAWSYAADGLRQGLIRLRGAFPDFVATVEGQLAEGDLVAVRYRGRGTHRSEMFGIPATGRSIDYGHPDAAV